MSAKLLLVDDDRYVLNPLSRLLAQSGFHCTLAVTGTEALRLVDSGEFDLMLLDIGLTDIDGVTVCRRVRAKHTLPIIMVTARDSSSDKILGLEIGADDYITKPFEPGELVARIRAQLRRTQEYSSTPAIDNRLTVGDLTLDINMRDAIVDGKQAHLTTREFELLYLLARNRNRALARDWIFEEVWGYDAELGVKALAVCIRRLRCKIEADPERPALLHTVRGYGYKLSDGHDVAG
jgi:two-component system response regulator VicR